MTKSTEHFSLTIISDCNELENVSNHWFSSRKCFIFKVHKKVPGFGKNLEWKNETFLDIFTHRVKVLPPSFFSFSNSQFAMLINFHFTSHLFSVLLLLFLKTSFPEFRALQTQNIIWNFSSSSKLSWFE